MSCFDATHKKKKKTKKLHDEKTPRNNDLLRSQYFDGSMDFIEQQKHAIFLSLSLYGREWYAMKNKRKKFQLNLVCVIPLYSNLSRKLTWMNWKIHCCRHLFSRVNLLLYLYVLYRCCGDRSGQYCDGTTAVHRRSGDSRNTCWTWRRQRRRNNVWLECFLLANWMIYI